MFRKMTTVTFKKSLIVGLSTVLLSSCTATKNAWNATTSAASDLVSFESDEADVKTAELKARWKHSVGKQNDFLQMAVDGKVVYVVNTKGNIKGYTIAEGEKVADFKIDSDDIVAGLGLSENSLLMADDNGFVYSVDKNSGELNWKKAVNVEILVAPIGASGNVYVHGIDGTLMALSGLTGDVLWRYQHQQPGLTLRGGSTPIIVNDSIISGFADGSLVANDLSAGYIIWDLSLGNLSATDDIQQLSDIDVQPILDENGILFVSVFQGRTIALDINSGQVLWETPVNTVKPFVLAEQFLYLINNDNEIVKVNRYSGSVEWTESYDAEDLASLIAVFRQDDRIFVLNDEGVAFQVNKQDATLLSRKKVANKKGISMPVNIDNTLIILSRSGKLTAY